MENNFQQRWDTIIKGLESKTHVMDNLLWLKEDIATYIEENSLDGSALESRIESRDGDELRTISLSGIDLISTSARYGDQGAMLSEFYDRLVQYLS